MPRIAGIDKTGHAIGSFLDAGYDNVLPPGTLLCDGSAVSRTTYANLFAVIGTTWGVGDGTSTFNLPDNRGMFRRGRDHGAGNDPDRVTRTANRTGGDSGDAVGSVQADQFYSHNHADAGHLHSAPPGTQFVTAVPGTGNTSIPGGNNEQGVNNTATSYANIQANGGNETRPKNIYANMVIVYV
jgi:microcystin-dependent protein